MRRVCLIAALHLVVLTDSARADDDPIRAKLDQANDAYSATMAKIKQKILDALQAKEEVARANGNKSLVDQIKAERTAFESSQKMPKVIPVGPYLNEMVQARTLLETAFKDAIKGYNKAKRDSDADKVQDELNKFEESRPILQVGAMSVGFLQKPPPGWALRELRVNAILFSDRGYKVTDFPKEMAGGTLLVRNSGELKTWLRTKTVQAQSDGNVYVMVRARYLGKPDADEAMLKSLIDDGWDEVKGNFAVNHPKGEDWGWRTFRKGVKKGEISLDAKLNDVALIFAFK